MKARQFISILICLLGLFSAPAWAQLLNGYRFATGVNTSRWLHLTHPDTLLDRTTPSTTYGTAAVPMGFLFRMMGEEIQSFSVHKSGRMYLNQSYNLNDFRTIHLNTPYTTNYLMPYGILRGWDSTATVVYQILGSPGNRVLVCEFAIKANSYSIDLSRFQIHLEEYSGTVRFVYGPRNDPSQGPEGEIGFARNYLQYNLIHPNLHRAAANTPFANMPDHLSWPGNYRYYEFIPQCIGMTHIVVDSIWRTHARVYWDGSIQHQNYIVEYGLVGFPDGQRSYLVSSSDTVFLTGLTHSTTYEVRVRAICLTGDTSEAISYTFTTTPYYPACSNIPFTDFYHPDVTCRIGTFTSPNQSVQIIDLGPDNQLSRHTVHTDTSEYDPRTNLQLRTIPPGHCSSVRLGNWLSGAQQESITYTLHVDTTDYDLLILRYAIVEQNPNHPAEEQPYFTLSIKDSTGRIIDDCHYANFVSGDASGWNGQNIVWHDWDAMGMNLTPFHGQTIHVVLSNADCSMSGHYGYAYFTLEGATKHLNATSCGSSATNTFYAPAGFNYRWYNVNNSAATLSTGRSLHVTAEGTYECRVTYRLAGQNCGFTLRTRAGPRYPYAQFAMDNLDPCGSRRRFLNQSVVATDIDRTQLTSEPCEKVFWRFDDGSIDTNENPIRTFANGAHSATLIAMLANGLCIDSVTHYFTVNMPVDTMTYTVCPGRTVMYGDLLLTDSGTYVFQDNCVQQVVQVRYIPSVIPLIRDTICPRGAFVIGTQRYNTAGEYTILTPWPDHNGCDSMIHLSLSVTYRESEEDVYDTICEGGYVEYHGIRYSQPGRGLLDTLWSNKGCPTIRMLDLTVFPTYSDTLRDTLDDGHYFSFADTLVPAPGVYTLNYPTQQGCDSLFRIELSCRNIIDTTVCITGMPVEWMGRIFTEADSHHVTFRSAAGTDSLVGYALHVRPLATPQVSTELGCYPAPHYVISLPAGYRYRWHSEPTDSTATESTHDGLWQITTSPDQYTRYLFSVDYPDAPSCPGEVSTEISPSEFFLLSMRVTPTMLTSENLTLTVAENGVNVLKREWYIDSILQPTSGKVLTYEASPRDDSLRVTLIGSSGDCIDTVSQLVPVKRHDLLFPNVFTPGLEENNRFNVVCEKLVGYELWIYDRRGILMFHTTDRHEGWDGTSNGVQCRQEVYTYACRYQIDGYGWETIAGTVLLLR